MSTQDVPTNLNYIIQNNIVPTSVPNDVPILDSPTYSPPLVQPTDTKNLEWYDKLNKSKLTPPNHIFSFAWGILYLMIFTSFLIYMKSNKENNKTGLNFFMIQLILNLSWAPVFFTLKNPKIALYIIVILLVFIAATIVSFYKVNPISAYLLIPYFIWVLFATYLNFFIVANNKI